MTKAKGVSLISLVITIAIMLILAGVTITAVFDKDGILHNSKEFASEVENKRNRKEKELNTLIDDLDYSAMKINDLISTSISWFNEKATLTISLLDDNCQIQYKVEDGEYTQYLESITDLNHGDEVEIRIIKAGKTVKTSSIPIVDKTLPENAIINLDKIIAVTGENIAATVTHTENESGINIGNSKYIYNATQTKLGVNSTQWNSATAFNSNGQTLTLTSNQLGTYYLHVLTIDKAGNKKETVSEAVDVVNGVILCDKNNKKVGITANNLGQYLGEKVDYTPTSPNSTYTTGTMVYRLFYIDFNNKYNDGEKTIYLKADWNKTVTKQTKTNISNENIARMKNLNPSWENPNTSYINTKAVAWLTDETEWQGYKQASLGANVNYVVGSPSLEMWVDSYNIYLEAHKGIKDNGGTDVAQQLEYVYASPGYKIGKKDRNYDEYEGRYQAANSLIATGGTATMYNPGNLKYWLASPARADDRVRRIDGEASRVAMAWDDNQSVAPMVSIKPTANLKFSEYVK